MGVFQISCTGVPDTGRTGHGYSKPCTPCLALSPRVVQVWRERIQATPQFLYMPDAGSCTLPPC